MGCPDCRGVLAVSSLAGHLWFTCSVGHAFDSESLLGAKEEQLETALWTCVEMYSELAIYYAQIAARARGGKATVVAREWLDRSRRAQRNHDTLRRLVSTDGPPALKKGTR